MDPVGLLLLFHLLGLSMTDGPELIGICMLLTEFGLAWKRA
jgi:hypothetical protein